MNKHSVILDLMNHYRSISGGSTENFVCKLFFIAPFDFVDSSSVDVFYVFGSNSSFIVSYINYIDKNADTNTNTNTSTNSTNEIQCTKGSGYALCKPSTGTKVQIHGATYDTASTEDMFQLSTICNTIEYDLLKITSAIGEYHRVNVTLYGSEADIPSAEELIEDYNNFAPIKYVPSVLEEHNE